MWAILIYALRTQIIILKRENIPVFGSVDRYYFWCFYTVLCKRVFYRIRWTCSHKPIQFKPEEMVSTDQEIKHLLDRKIDEQVKQSDMVTEPAGQSAFDTQNDTWCVFVCPEIVKKQRRTGRRYQNTPLLVQRVDKETIFIISTKANAFFGSKNKLINLTQMYIYV